MGDPVATRIVPRLNQPGGNITGFAPGEATLAGKWLELLSEIAPGLKRGAIMFNADKVLNTGSIKLNAAAVEALADQAVRSRLVDFGSEVYPRERLTPEALGALRKTDAEKWWPIIKELGIKPE